MFIYYIHVSDDFFKNRKIVSYILFFSRYFAKENTFPSSLKEIIYKIENDKDY